MAHLHDSPLNEPIPPPPKFKLPSVRTCGWVGSAIIGVVVVAGAIAPLFLRQSKCRDWGPPEVNNLRQIGLALFEFENEYGKYPDATTIDAVRMKSGTELPLGTITSNDFFRQLIAVGLTQSESIFYAKVRGSKMPDNLLDASHCLANGEVGFAYLSGLTLEGNPSRPLVVAPLVPGTARFDPKPFKGKAIILRMDNSVSSLKIDKDGRVMIAGENILDPKNPIWDGHPPVIVWPE